MAKQTAKGFRPPAKRTATLKFVDGDYAGAVVVCRVTGSVGLLLSLMRVTNEVEVSAEMFQDFGDQVLEEWNLIGADGKPEAANGKGMLRIDENFAAAIISAWLDARASVPAPLAVASLSGSTSPEE